MGQSAKYVGKEDVCDMDFVVTIIIIIIKSITQKSMDDYGQLKSILMCHSAILVCILQACFFSTKCPNDKQRENK